MARDGASCCCATSGRSGSCRAAAWSSARPRKSASPARSPRRRAGWSPPGRSSTPMYYIAAARRHAQSSPTAVSSIPAGGPRAGAVAEHRRIGLFAPDDITRLVLPAGYRPRSRAGLRTAADLDRMLSCPMRSAPGAGRQVPPRSAAGAGLQRGAPAGTEPERPLHGRPARNWPARPRDPCALGDPGRGPDEPLSVSDVARRLALARQSVQRIADVLVREGLCGYRDTRITSGRAAGNLGRGARRAGPDRSGAASVGRRAGGRIGEDVLRRAAKALAAIAEAVQEADPGPLPGPGEHGCGLRVRRTLRRGPAAIPRGSGPGGR